MIPATRNFSPAEVLAASSPATPADVQENARNIGHTLETLEKIRALLGDRPITMTSLLRTAQENAQEGGSPTSGHLNGSAVDFQVSGLTGDQVVRLLAPHVIPLGLDQVIVYQGHIHVGTGAKRRGQILDKRSGVLTVWTPDAIIPPPIVPDATRTPGAMTPQTPAPKKDNRALIIGAIIAALGGILAWLQSGGAGTAP